MMGGIEESLRAFFMEMAQHPIELYLGVILVLFASSFGLPMPEEVVLLSSGVIAYMALNESAQTGLPPTISPITIAIVCLAAVLLSDLLVFTLGRRYGLPLLEASPLRRLIKTKSFERVERWTDRYGAWACAIFRFTPGIRFPGHFMCGAMKISYLKFLMTDGVAAVLTVPIQVLIIAYYGEDILKYIKQFKIVLLSSLGLAFIAWVIVRERQRRIVKN